MAKENIIIKYQSYGLFIIRVAIGIAFLLHGSQKLFGFFGGPGLNGFIEYTNSLGVPVLFGYLAAIFEFLGGAMLLLGIATELGALIVIPVMIGAVLLVHGNNGYFIQNNGYEYALNLAIILIAIIISGPGKYALWDPFKELRNK